MVTNRVSRSFFGVCVRRGQVAAGGGRSNERVVFFFFNGTGRADATELAAQSPPVLYGHHLTSITIQ